MKEILETNVLIIGKSGVGKSSLLNYIFDNPELAKTGTGKPVTKEGIFHEKLKVSDDFFINIYDTWGLEANKSKEWEELIKTEINKHDCEDISDWFHTILFCISAKSSRVEDFEKLIIKKLIDDGNKVVVILTHSDTNNVSIAIEKMKEELEDILIEDNNIIKVSSVGKKLLGGRTTERFGKEDVLFSIQSNLWETICNKLPRTMDKIIDDSIEKWYRESKKFVEDDLQWYGSKSNKKLEKIKKHIEYLLDTEIRSLEYKLEKRYSDVYNYYFRLSQAYNMVIQEKEECFNLNYNFDLKMSKGEIVAEKLAIFTVSLIPFYAFRIPSILRDERIKYIDEELKELRSKLSKELKTENREQIEKLKKYSIN